MDEMTLTLDSPITEEQWDMILDVDFENTQSITFHTKYGKEVEFVKRKRGNWIPTTDGRYKCDVCKSQNDTDTDFCPNCGADMR